MARLTLKKLVDENKEIWVRNKSWEVRGIAAQLPLLIDKDHPGGKLTIPPGDDPVCLTDLFPIDELKKCKDLFAHIHAGTLELMDPDEADKYFEKNQGRLEKSKQKLEDIMKKKTEPVKEMPKVEVKPAQLNHKVRSIVHKLRKGGMDESQAAEKLVEIQRSLTTEDFSFIAAQASKAPEIKKWALDQLQNVEDEE